MSLSSFGKPIYEMILKIFDVDNFKLDIDYLNFTKILPNPFLKNY